MHQVLCSVDLQSAKVSCCPTELHAMHWSAVSWIKGCFMHTQCSYFGHPASHVQHMRLQQITNTCDQSTLATVIRACTYVSNWGSRHGVTSIQNKPGPRMARCGPKSGLYSRVIGVFQKFKLFITLVTESCPKRRTPEGSVWGISRWLLKPGSKKGVREKWSFLKKIACA